MPHLFLFYFLEKIRAQRVRITQQQNKNCIQCDLRAASYKIPQNLRNNTSFP